MIEGACATFVSETWLLDAHTQTMLTPAPTPPGQNLYCAGHSFLSDGRLFAVGGGGEAWMYPKNEGWIFDPTSHKWEPTRDATTHTQTKMSEQRWYPTVVTLGDHRVLIADGDLDYLPCDAPDPGDPPAMKMEIYTESTGNYDYVTTPADKYFRPTYPGLHLLPNHDIFFAPVGFRNNTELPGACAGAEDSAILSLSGLNGSWSNIGPQDRTKGMSVILFSDTHPCTQVMIVGGGDVTTSRTYTKIDLSSPSPVWGPDLSLPLRAGQTEATSRVHPNVVLLPDGTVFVAGGCDFSEPCWLYDPATLSWQEMDELNYSRRYHSFALLLPTAEVMACGGQNTPGQSTIEVFRPPYLFAGPQPKIQGVTPGTIHHGSHFEIKVPHASDIAKVTMVRPMAPTHQTDTEQRVIPLSFSMISPNTLKAMAPSPTHPHGVAPRGYYMLFIINNDGVPSTAEFVFLH